MKNKNYIRKKKTIKNRLVKRDGAYCSYCNINLSKYDDMTIDHIIPLSKGGSKYGYYNLVLSCKKCNNEKGDSDILEYIRNTPHIKPNATMLQQIIKCEKVEKLNSSFKSIKRDMYNEKSKRVEIDCI